MNEQNTEKTNADKMDAAQVRRSRILLAEDIKKLELAKAQALAQAAILDTRIAECMLALADVDRREAGVEYPEDTDKNAAPEPEAK